MADGVVIVEQGEYGTKLLKTISAIASSSDPTSVNEIEVRKVWYKKMLDRALKRDLEGQYRHIWSLFAILEDYFIFKKMRYQGPKKAFKYLAMNDPDCLSLFEAALSNTQDLVALKNLINRITQ